MKDGIDPTPALRFVHRLVCDPHPLRECRLPVTDPNGETNDDTLPEVEMNPRSHRLIQRRHRSRPPRSWDHSSEFVTAQPGYQSVMESPVDPVADLFDHSVTGPVTVGVVDGFEFVEVHHHHDSAVQERWRQVIEVSPVRKFGEFVVGHEPLELVPFLLDTEQLGSELVEHRFDEGGKLFHIKYLVPSPCVTSG